MSPVGVAAKEAVSGAAALRECACLPFCHMGLVPLFHTHPMRVSGNIRLGRTDLPLSSPGFPPKLDRSRLSQLMETLQSALPAGSPASRPRILLCPDPVPAWRREEEKPAPPAIPRRRVSRLSRGETRSGTSSQMVYPDIRKLHPLQNVVHPHG